MQCPAARSTGSFPLACQEPPAQTCEEKRRKGGSGLGLQQPGVLHTTKGIADKKGQTAAKVAS